MKVNWKLPEGLSGFVALGCKSVRAGLSTFKVQFNLQKYRTGLNNKYKVKVIFRNDYWRHLISSYITGGRGGGGGGEGYCRVWAK